MLSFMIHSIFWIFFLVSVESRNILPIPKCGIEASSSPIHRNPWLVFLEYYREELKIDIRCAATLIDSRHLVTAAHCVKTPKFTRLAARLGEYDLRSEKDCLDGICSETVHIEIIHITVHPEYDGTNNDIAILQLVSNAPYTDFIRPVCLPTGTLQPDITFEASGWGELPYSHWRSNIKKIIRLPFWDRENCVARYKNLPLNVICAGGKAGVDTCRGDSGGPLVWKKGRIELWGITSSGNSHCGMRNSPGIYTNIAEHLDWVMKVLDEMWDQLRSGR